MNLHFGNREEEHFLKKYVCAGLMCMLMLAASASLLSPAYARLQNTAVWSAEMLPRSDAEAEPELKTDLLIEGGQTVLLSKNEPYSIELELFAPDSEVSDLEITEQNCKAAIVKSPDNSDKYIFTIEKTEDPDTGEDSAHSATLTWNYKGKKLSATFEYMSEPQPDTGSTDKKAELRGLSAQYNENVPISFTVGEAPVILAMKNGENFPPKLRYTVNEKSVVLYDGGRISLEAGDTCYLDFSMTDFRQNVVLSAGDYEAEVAYLPVPALQRDSAPLIMSGETLELPVSFMWGDTEAFVKIYRLIPAEDGVQWQEYDKITAQTSDNGNIQLTSNNSPSGTYKIVINWHHSHTIETNFYIRCTGIS